MTAFPTVSKYFSFFSQTNFHMLHDSKQNPIRRALHPSSHPPKSGGALLAQVELTLHTPSSSKSAGSGRTVEQPLEPPGLPEGPEPCQNCAKAPAQGGKLQEAWIARRCTPSHFSLFCSLLGNLASLVLLLFLAVLFIIIIFKVSFMANYLLVLPMDSVSYKSTALVF